MFHTELFSSSIGTGANTFAQVNYVSTNAVLAALVNGLQVSADFPYLAMVAGVSANLVHVRAQAPSMQQFPYITIGPNNRGTAFESPPRVMDLFNQPLALRVTEEFDIFATQNAGVAQTPFVGVTFSNGHIDKLPIQINPPTIQQNPITPGRFFTAHATATQTLTASAWTQVTLNFDQALFAGYYAIVGARVFSASALFFRLFPAMNIRNRPGGVAVQAYDQLDPEGQRAIPYTGGIMAPWGVWLTFYQNVPPKIEMFATAADAAQEFWLDLVYLGPQILPAVQ